LDKCLQEVLIIIRLNKSVARNRDREKGEMWDLCELMTAIELILLFMADKRGNLICLERKLRTFEGEAEALSTHVDFSFFDDLW
jgi:hypothetical protein